MTQYFHVILGATTEQEAAAAVAVAAAAVAVAAAAAAAEQKMNDGAMARTEGTRAGDSRVLLLGAVDESDEWARQTDIGHLIGLDVRQSLAATAPCGRLRRSRDRGVRELAQIVVERALSAKSRLRSPREFIALAVHAIRVHRRRFKRAQPSHDDGAAAAAAAVWWFGQLASHRAHRMSTWGLGFFSKVFFFLCETARAENLAPVAEIVSLARTHTHTRHRRAQKKKTRNGFTSATFRVASASRPRHR
jgi:hypothetical protein